MKIINNSYVCATKNESTTTWWNYCLRHDRVFIAIQTASKTADKALVHFDTLSLHPEQDDVLTDYGLQTLIHVYNHYKCKLRMLCTTSSFTRSNIPIATAHKLAAVLCYMFEQPKMLYNRKTARRTAQIAPTIQRDLLLGRIYRGFDPFAKKYYIGQTRKKAEHRFIGHCKGRTGPFREGADDIEWKTIERLLISDLDQREAYWIGYYNSYNNGFNLTRGNDLPNYKQGLKDGGHTL